MEDPAGFVPPVADEDRFPVVEAAFKKQRMSGLDIFRLDVTKKYKNMIMSHNLRLNLTDKFSACIWPSVFLTAFIQMGIEPRTS